MEKEPLLTTLLELDFKIESPNKLIVAGGYGLFLKQLHLRANSRIKTLFSGDELPSARTTADIDLVLRAELVTDSASMKPIREALDTLGFSAVPSAEYWQFVRSVDGRFVKIDLLAGPLGEYAGRVPNDQRRVKPRPSVKLHARKMDEALAVEKHPVEIPIRGILSDGTEHSAVVLVPQAFSYLLTKLFAFRDQSRNRDKDLGRHHALDIYRIVGLLTENEDMHVRMLSEEYSEHPTVLEACKIVETFFGERNSLGNLRIREHELAVPGMNLEKLCEELKALFPLQSLQS